MRHSTLIHNALRQIEMHSAVDAYTYISIKCFHDVYGSVLFFIVFVLDIASGAQSNT